MNEKNKSSFGFSPDASATVGVAQKEQGSGSPEKSKSFDLYANEYDSWFLNNEALLYSEVKLVARCLENAGKIFSVGCGSGLFEYILKKEFDIIITHGLEPSDGMAEIARQRGMQVLSGTAEGSDYGTELYDTILFNGTPSYIANLQAAFERAFKALKPGGRLVVIDVPKEGSYALLYNLAMTLGTWEHPLLEGIKPRHPYPIEFVKGANWRTTGEKVELLEAFDMNIEGFYQTLTPHPLYSGDEIEEPIEGYSKGDYVAIIAKKNSLL